MSCSGHSPYPGLFITIEGGEGSGKSTLAAKLGALLKERGYTVMHTREPGGSPLSEHIRELLLDPNRKYPIGERAELLLFLAGRAEHVEEKILPALRRGEIVICERFHDSTIAYQGGARHLGMHYVSELCHHIFGAVLEPTCTLFLDLDPADGKERVKKRRSYDRIEQEDIHFHQEVRYCYLVLADQCPGRITLLDATLPPDELAASAMNVLEKILPVRNR